jgi:signal transduction histidine kinase
MKRLVVRIFLAFFAVLLVSALGAILLTAWFLDERQQTAETELLEAAQAAAAALADGGRTSLLEWTRSRANEERTSMDILVIDETGRELLGRPLPVPPPPASADTDDYWDYDLPAVLLNLPKSSPELVGADGESFRLFAAPRRTGLSAWLDVPLQVLLLALSVTLLMSLLLARSITRPILALQHTTESLATGELEARVPEPARSRRDEIGRLARSLDSMAERLGSLIRGQRQLLRDVSHEVRSPLTRIRLAAGLLAQRDPASAAAVARIDDEVSRLDELIDKILDVSRLESGATSWQPESLDLRNLTEGILTDAAFEASRLGKTLETDLGDPPVHITGDRHWVLAAIENVVRNALKHTPEGSRVRVELRQTGHTARLRVSDTGRGLAENELQRIFEPFYRGSHDGDGVAASPRAAGSGLGLAIAARVVQGHGGRITACNLRNEVGVPCGLEISLEWPVAPTPAPVRQTAGGP